MKFLEYIDGAHFASANKDQMALRKYKFFIPYDQNHLFPVPGAGSSIAKLFIGPSYAELERSFHVTTARMFEILVDPSIILAALENLSPEDLETFYQEIQGSWDGLYERCCNEPWFDEIEYLCDDSQIASILRQPIIDKLRELLGLPTQQ